MKKKDEVLNMEKEEVKETGLMIKDFGQMESYTSKSKTNIFTTITDPTTIFNLTNNEADYRLNDCKGETIRVVDVLIKTIETPLAEPEVDEAGNIVKDKEYKKVCILIDDNGKSYVTGSKMFTNQMMRYINMFGIADFDKGLEIKIVERSVKNSSNKALGFELVD